MNEWQPIETAPKNGTVILLGRFMPEPESQMNGLICTDYWHKQKMDEFTGWGKFNTAWLPTHWMPLPEPPK